MEVHIDKNSGYCFGVEYAIAMAEEEMATADTLYCLGDIVHNSMEVKRLSDQGLRIIDRDQLRALRDCKVLIRAHGEPPETYQLALKNNLQLIDASCPVVLKLQNRVKYAFDQMTKIEGQIVIYGEQGHAEVVGLSGQTRDQAVVIASEGDLSKLDYTRPIALFSQTTKSTSGFYRIKERIEANIRQANPDLDPAALAGRLDANDSICRQVSNREPQLQKFAAEHDVIVFVSGKKSSNGKALFGVCQAANPRSYFVENETEVVASWFEPTDRVGIGGATSTPLWLMENVARHVAALVVAPEVG
ncbi:MAG: 4-hydroxy-3-methylbut-2-enyl diphosphate reductase [Ferruginibacter sp.]|nr:4-hydroxy-3-methylbut-2-enyl diphosphate reductase [Cytophagales bacterium]